MTHPYSKAVASNVGVPAAVILWRLCERITQNMEDGAGNINGTWWTEVSAEVLQNELPDLTIAQVRYAVGKLKKNGMIAIGSFSKGTRNNTNWYSVTPYGWACMEDARIELGVSRCTFSTNT